MEFVNTELNSYEYFLLFPMKEAGEFWPLDLSDIPAPHSLLPTCCLLYLFCLFILFIVLFAKKLYKSNEI